MSYLQVEKRYTVGGSFHVKQEPPGWIENLAGWATATGINVTPDNALEVGTVYACVRVLSESVAQLPLLLYRRIEGDARERATDHPLFWLLRYQPNPEMTSFEFRETLTAHLLTWGNAYAEIEYDNGGRVIGLWPLRPDRMVVKRVSGTLHYIYRLSKPDASGRTEKILDAWRVLHLRGLASNGIVGYSPIQLQRLGVSLARAAEEYGGRFYGNDARPGGVLEHPGHLSEEAQKRLRDTWEIRHGGLDKSHRLAVLEEGMKFHEIGLPPEEAQFLGTRKYQRSEIAGWYRVPLHLIGDLERATFSNIEHQGQDFLTYSLGAWLVRWEQRAFVQLLTRAEQRQYFAEHLVNSLLRGDAESRGNFYNQGRQGGWLSANDIRRMENLNPIEGGDIYLVPLNLVPADEVGFSGSLEDGQARALPSLAGERALPPDEQRSMQAARSRQRLMLAHMGVYRDVAARVLRRERNDVGNAARRFFQQRDLGSFLLWLEDFYREHREFTRQQFAAVAAAYAELVAGEAQREVGVEPEMTPELEAFVRRYLEIFADRHAQVSMARIRETVVEAEDPLEALGEVLEAWPEVRAEETARWESARFNNAVAVAVYGLVGVVRLIWRAFGKSCPYCSALNGRVVGIREFFLAGGEDFQPEGAERPLRPNNNVGHAPAHDGCDCMVMADL